MSSSAVETREALAVDVAVSEDTIAVELADGRTIAAPLAWYPRLAHGSAEERGAWRLLGGGRGIHWPALDEDISVANLLAGQPSAESQSSFKKWLASRSKPSRNRRKQAGADQAPQQSGHASKPCQVHCQARVGRLLIWSFGFNYWECLFLSRQIMADNGKMQIQPVEGEIVRDSPLKTLALCLLAIFVLAPIGAGLVWAWWTGASLLKWQVTWYGALIGAVLVAGGLLAVPVSFLCFIRRNRLIIGKTCLQVVRVEKVTIQIPYKNITRIGLGQADVIGKYVGIDLRDPNDAETLCPGAATRKDGFGWHYTLSDESWTVPLTHIHDLIKTCMASHSSANK